ncbi:tRNA(His) guanylyltransferase Thg1 family protein [Corallococcus llansteffanensis]|uniref:tRNA(His) guanylyltransferase n=1 Tax=Corallococcus llansteffanensis TaxID=2316731 RepID=A0A3A8P2W9_9BACT|nr:tRNA(His) guanylyltransferase Thg1 family protein [Corallococcus llansteffanensis]RKH49770.1 guanylyltransferase [Corallococcus llansteffanensis]
MKFDALDEKMRVFETAHDLCVLPGVHIVARLDGRGFTRLTKEVHRFESPFDVRVRDLMVSTTGHLMDRGFRVLYGYTQSDEISLLFHPEEDAFGRKTRKLNSLLAGEASAKFSLLLGDLAAFDCRICELPSAEHVRDYFRWRSEDAHRNALNSHCYWSLRREGQDVEAATSALRRLSAAQKKDLLLQRGVEFHELPAWQRRGTGLSWEMYAKDAADPRTGQAVAAQRRRIKVDFELPVQDAYGAFIQSFLDAPEGAR